jgi:hypothetical protein
MDGISCSVDGNGSDAISAPHGFIVLKVEDLVGVFPRLKRLVTEEVTQEAKVMGWRSRGCIKMRDKRPAGDQRRPRVVTRDQVENGLLCNKGK